MKDQHLIILLTFFCIGMGCKDNNSPEQPTEINESVLGQVDSSATPPPATTSSKMMYVWVDLLRIREFPNPTSDVLIKIPEGDSLTFLGEETLDKMKLTLRGKEFNEPWLKVKTNNGTVGWAYGGGLTNVAPPSDRSHFPFDNCYKIENGYWTLDGDCMSQTAKTELQKDSRFVTKRNTELIFNLLNGDLKSFQNSKSDNSEEYVNYEYAYYIKKMGYFVLEKGLFEGREYLLINDKTGKETLVPGFPKPSPNAQRILVTSADLTAGFLYNGLQIWKLENGLLKLEWENELLTLEPFAPKWLDNKTIQVSMQKPAQEQQREDPITTYIRMGEDGDWNME